MRISDWSSDVCSSDLAGLRGEQPADDAADHHQPPARTQNLDRLLQAFAQHVQLTIDVDADRLEAARCRMDVARAWTQHRGDQVRKLRGRRQRRPAEREIGRASWRARASQYV